MGIIADDLYDYLSFSEWFQGTLAPELEQLPLENFVLRRRILATINCWLKVQFDPACRPLLYRYDDMACSA